MNDFNLNKFAKKVTGNIHQSHHLSIAQSHGLFVASVPFGRLLFPYDWSLRPNHELPSEPPPKDGDQGDLCVYASRAPMKREIFITNQ